MMISILKRGHCQIDSDRTLEVTLTEAERHPSLNRHNGGRARENPILWLQNYQSRL